MKISPDKIDNSVKVVITFENQSAETFICSPSDNIKKCLLKFAENLKIEFKFLYFLYSGTRLKDEDMNKNIYDIMNSFDKAERNMNLLGYRSIEISSPPADPNVINIIIIFESTETEIIKENRDKLMRDIFKPFADKKKLNLNSLLFKYGDKKIDLNKKFDDIANNLDKQCLGMTILVYKRTPLSVIFLYNNKSKYAMNCFMEERIGDVINLYCYKNNFDIKNLLFLYENQTMNMNNTFLDLNTYEGNKSEYLNLNINSNENNIKIINIKVYSKYNPETNSSPPRTQTESLCKKYQKSLLITLGIVLGFIILIIVIILVTSNKEEEDDKKSSSSIATTETLETTTTEINNNDHVKENCLTSNNINECEKCDIGYDLVDGKCEADIIFKAVYETENDGDTIDLFNMDFYLSRILYMIVDGKNITKPNQRYYQFLEKGKHNVYIKIDQYNLDTIFSGLTNLVSFKFTNFKKYKPSFNFPSMFRNCIKLTSVDFSELYFEYSGGLNYIFEGCSSLTYVNMKIKKFKLINSIEKMFYKCKSLTSIELPDLDVSEITSFEYMFSECNSLISINLRNFKLDKAKKINFMFEHCYSLKSLDLSSFKPVILEEMKSVFYNCSSLVSLNLNQFYTSQVKDMNNLFFNCSSLKYLDISSFNTQKVIYMYKMFQNCKALTSINFGSSFVTNNVGAINAFFSGCNSLEQIDFDITITSMCSRNLTECFKDCYSLKSIKFQSFDLDFYAKLRRTFSGCYSLTSIDFSEAQVARTYDSMIFKETFYDCPNLANIKFFKLNYSNEYDLFNENISNTGTLLINQKFHDFLTSKNKLPPSTWTIEHY